MNLLQTRSLLINVLLALIFILFAIVQLNDPDPFVWFTLYLLVALFSLISIFREVPRPLLYGFGLVLLFYAAMHLEFAIEWIMSENKGELFGEMQEEKQYLEGTREFLGLLIALAALAYLIQQQKTHSRVENGS